MFLVRRRRGERAKVERLYGAIVAQARLPVFYSEYAVPDTVEGRFDLLVLHVNLLFRRLARESKPQRETAQEVFDLFFEDMDASLRELGIGDLAVPRKMRAMGEAFYGRAGAYDAALADTGEGSLAAALSRNVYGAAAEESGRLARYVRRAEAALTSQAADVIAGGELYFPSPDEIE
jgi:cytochrome b pre-mRNA-processing protein 3